MVIVVQDGDGEKQLKCELVAAWFPINHFFPSMVDCTIGTACHSHPPHRYHIYSFLPQKYLFHHQTTKILLHHPSVHNSVNTIAQCTPILLQ